MANIDIKNISDLDLNGNGLFEDSESFMTELSDDDEQVAIMGGLADALILACKNTCETHTNCSCNC